MDPLSITVGVLTFLGAAKDTVKGLERLKALGNAPKEIQLLINEVTDIQLAISQLDRTLQARGQLPDAQLSSMFVISPLLERAKERMESLDQLINHRLLTAG